jgi:hypothetical protein
LSRHSQGDSKATSGAPAAVQRSAIAAIVNAVARVISLLVSAMTLSLKLLFKPGHWTR